MIRCVFWKDHFCSSVGNAFKGEGKTGDRKVHELAFTQLQCS